MARSKFEIKAQKELESEGYYVDYKARPHFVSRGYHVDYFNLFDLMAYKKPEPIRFISIKGQAQVPSRHRRNIETFWVPEGFKKEIWTYRKIVGSGNKLIPRKEVIK